MDETLIKIGKLLNSWRDRCGTISGRITVVKTLAMSKLFHIFTSLPPPNILKINIMIFSFIWKDGPDRIKRSVITNNYTEDGLKMVETLTFIKALKVSWLRRYFQSESKWKWFLNKYIYNLTIAKLGANVGEYVNKTFKNPFCNDVLNAWEHFVLKTKIKTCDEIVNEPLRYNTHFKNTSLFIRNWYNTYTKYFNRNRIYHSFFRVKAKI